MNPSGVTIARPAGYPPRETWLGLAGLAILSVGVPFITLQSLVPVLPDGVDLWLGSMLPVLAFSMATMLVVALGLHRRRGWYIWFINIVGTILLCGYLGGTILGVIIAARMVPLAHPDLHFISIVNLIFWLILTPFSWALLRMIRLHYWQPWTAPESWEPADPSPPRWGGKTKPVTPWKP